MGTAGEDQMAAGDAARLRTHLEGIGAAAGRWLSRESDYASVPYRQLYRESLRHVVALVDAALREGAREGEARRPRA